MAEDDKQRETPSGGGAAEPDALAVAQAQKAAAEADQARADADTARAEAERTAAEARRLDAETERLQAEAASMSVEAARANAEKEKLRAEAQRAAADLEKLEAEKQRAVENQQLAKSLNEAAERGPDVRAFVRQSLLDIMAGVDDAAAMGRTRALNEGLDGYLPSVTKIDGSPADGPGTDRVEFDLAVTVARSATKQTGGGAQVDGSFKLGVLGFGTLHVGASGHIERTVGGASSDERTNRLRFSVPIVYAVQDEPPDEE